MQVSMCSCLCKKASHSTAGAVFHHLTLQRSKDIAFDLRSDCDSADAPANTKGAAFSDNNKALMKSSGLGHCGFAASAHQKSWGLVFLSGKPGGSAPLGDYTLLLALLNSYGPIEFVVLFVLYNSTVR